MPKHPVVLARLQPLTIPFAFFILGMVSRLVGLMTAFDVNDDEIYYSELGKSFREGFFPPRFAGFPFLLHPPLYFAMSAAWEDILKTGPTLLDLIARSREVNAFCAAVSAAIIYLIARKLAGPATGVVSGALFLLDPYLLQINGRALLETSTWMFGLAGWVVLFRLFNGRPQRPLAVATVGGLILGLSIVDKDIASVVAILPLAVALWRRWADHRLLEVAIGACLTPTVIYLIALTAVGSIGSWFSQETIGLKRLLGVERLTGFGEGHHPSLLAALIRQAPSYGTSYVVCGLGVLAAIYLVIRSERNDWKILGAVTLAGAITMVYATVFGTIETQMFYFPAIPALIALPVACSDLLRGRSVVRTLHGMRRRRSVGVLGTIYIGAVAIVLGVELTTYVGFRTTPDSGMTQLVSWFEKAPRPTGTIANSTDVPELLLARYGYSTVAAGTPTESRLEHVEYLTVLSANVAGGYSTLTTNQTDWYEANGVLAYRTQDRSYGIISVYRTKSVDEW